MQTSNYPGVSIALYFDMHIQWCDKRASSEVTNSLCYNDMWREECGLLSKQGMSCWDEDKAKHWVAVGLGRAGREQIRIN